MKNRIITGGLMSGALLMSACSPEISTGEITECNPGLWTDTKTTHEEVGMIVAQLSENEVPATSNRGGIDINPLWIREPDGRSSWIKNIPLVDQPGDIACIVTSEKGKQELVMTSGGIAVKAALEIHNEQD